MPGEPFLLPAIGVWALSRLAIVHDFLTQYGGAERVAIAMAETFPDAPLFTSIYDPKSTYQEFSSIDVRTMPVLGHMPSRHFRFGAAFFGFGFERLPLDGFDKVLVSSSVFAHHIRHDNAYVYCHTPPRFTYDLENCTSSVLLRNGVRPVLGMLKARDVAAASRHQNYVANSRTTRARIEQCYGRTVKVLNPPLDPRSFMPALTAAPAVKRALVIARLQPYKRIDLAIDACHRVGVALTVVGRGPEEERLRSLAEDKDVSFVSGLSDSELAEVIAGHSLLLVPGVEDYGLTPLEASYSGRPVIGRLEGGVSESVVEGTNGHLIQGDDVGEWAEAIEAALSEPWDIHSLRETTIPFQLEAFQQRLRSWMNE